MKPKTGSRRPASRAFTPTFSLPVLESNFYININSGIVGGKNLNTNSIKEV